MAPGRQLFRHVRRDPGLLASPDSFRGSRRQQCLGGGLGPRAAHPRVRALQGGRVQPDAITARPFGPAGCEGSRRPDRSHRHRYDPRPRPTKGLPRVRSRSHPRRSGEGRRRHLPRPYVSVDGCELARRCGEGDGAPAGVICPSSLRCQAQEEKTMSKTMTNHRTGTREEWLAAREKLLAREKEHTRLGDEIARLRRDLPWVRVGKKYRFDTDDGTRTLAQLFDGRSQLVVYHFMFGPSYQAGDPPNSSIADAVTGILSHLHARDVTMVFVSQAPIEKLQAFKRRMGWSFPWVSSANTEFNVDLGFSASEEQTRGWLTPAVEAEMPPIVSRNAQETGTDVVRYLTESPGFSVFALDDGAVYHTYSAGARGVEFLMSYYARR